MDGEISKGTWSGTTVLAIVAILGLCFAVFGIARTLINNSSADFVKTVDSVGQSGFNDFDGTVVSGLQVRNALDTYEGDKIAVFINTSGIQKIYNETAAIQSAPAQLFAQTGTYPNVTYTYLKRKEATQTAYDVDFVLSNKLYINYNALLSDADATHIKSTSEGYLEYSGMFKLTSDNDLMINSVKTNYKNTGLSEFIAVGANFNAKLIKDGSGTVVGIVFTQVY